MRINITKLLACPRAVLSSFSAAAPDPRELYADEFERPVELLERVRQAAAGVTRALARLERYADRVRRNLEQVETSADTSFAEDSPAGIDRVRDEMTRELLDIDGQILELRSQQIELDSYQRQLEARLRGLLGRRELDAASGTALEAHQVVESASAGLAGQLDAMDARIAATRRRTVSLQREAVDRGWATGSMAESIAELESRANLVRSGLVTEAKLARFTEIKGSLNSGLERLEALASEYRNLQQFLSGEDTRTGLSAARLGVLSTETYQQGITVMERFLMMAREHRTDMSRRRGGQQQEQITSAFLAQSAVLLKQASDCEGALRAARNDVMSLSAGESESTVNVVTGALKRTVEQAKQVQEQLNRMQI